jgi:hypothetical protein
MARPGLAGLFNPKRCCIIRNLVCQPDDGSMNSQAKPPVPLFLDQTGTQEHEVVNFEARTGEGFLPTSSSAGYRNTWPLVTAGTLRRC